MAKTLIASFVRRLLGLPKRLENVVTLYLMSLMIESPKHTFAAASRRTGLDAAQFSRLLSEHGELAKSSLRRVAEDAAKAAAKSRAPLAVGAPWSVAVIIDSTLHTRSSLHVHNAQRFNHGQGFVVGHQWTNIVILVSGETIPLPPIAFLSRNECKRRGVPYKTEHERIAEYLEGLELSRFIGLHDPAEVVVLTDSGYDSKLLERVVVKVGWDFLTAIKAKRAVKTDVEQELGYRYRAVDKLFWAVRKQAPWTTVRLPTDGGKKRRKFRARQLIGRMKGIAHDVSLICSEKSKGTGRRYFACSKTGLSVGLLLRVQQLRWRIELFHREVKEHFGMEDLGAHAFESIEAHVHWVYTAYIALGSLEVDGQATRLGKRRRLTRMVEQAPFVACVTRIAKARTQFGGTRRYETLAAAALRQAMAS